MPANKPKTRKNKKVITYDDKGRELCGATAKSTGKPCRSLAYPRNGRCKNHGGPTPAGFGSPNFKHGRWSEYLPKDLGARYAAALQDPDLLVLAHEIALLDARIGDLLLRFDTAETAAAWAKLGNEWAGFMEAVQTGNGKRQKQGITNLHGLITAAADNEQAWLELDDLIEKRRRLVDTEQKRQTAAKLLMSVEETMGIMSLFIANVKDAVRLHSSDADYKRIMSGVSVAYEKVVSENPN